MTDTLPIDIGAVNDLLHELHAAFPRAAKGTDAQATLRVYRNGLAGFSLEAVKGAVAKIIREDQHFPRVARIREVAHDWNRRNTTTASLVVGRTSRLCPICHTEPTTLNRWRPKLGAGNTLVLTADALALVLEPYSRELCGCAPACEYAPTLDSHPPAMPLSELPPHAQFRIAQQRVARAQWKRREIPREKPAPAAIAAPVGPIATQLATTGL